MVLDIPKPEIGRTKQARFRKRGVASAIFAAAITVAIAATLLFAGRTAEARQPKKPKQPNIVYVLLDDLRYDGMGFLNANLKTPNIDWLAANGVYLPGAVVTSSLCSPSRASILTGQSMRNHHVVDNNDSSEEGLVFFPSYLQQAGYQTGFVGKWHMGRASDGPRPGFDYWVSFAGQGNFLPTDGLSAEQVARGERNRLNVNGVHKPQAGYITTELTDYALDFLSHRDSSKPFFLYLSHKAVHQPVTPDEPHRGQYASMPFNPPVTMADTEENRAGKPMWLRNQRNSWHGVDYMYYGSEKLPDYVRRYYSTLSSVDDSLGRLITWLRANKQLDNTIIIFTSDNGFQFGEQGLIDKRTAYEASIRVPMVMYAPGLVPRGKTMPGMVRNIDLAPTLLEAAGAAAPPQFDGQSFLPLASGKVPASDWKRDLIYEYYWEWNFPQTPTTFAIVRDGWKYIQYQGLWDIEELYNITKDPNERHNRATDPALAAKLSELRAALFKGLEARDGSHAVSFTARTSPGVVLRNADGSGPATYPPGWMRSAPTTLTDRPLPEPQR